MTRLDDGDCGTGFAQQAADDAMQRPRGRVSSSTARPDAAASHGDAAAAESGRRLDRR